MNFTARPHAIRDRNDWRQFQNEESLAAYASVEMAELVRSSSGLTEDQSRTPRPSVPNTLARKPDIVHPLPFCGKPAST
ncbi:nucleotide pyrophosphohydrolase [Pseudomonas aeruginosa]